jgi:hypothetical protein
MGTRVHKIAVNRSVTAVNRSVTAVTGLTEPARLLKPTGNHLPNRAYEIELSANRSVWSVYRSSFVEFENRHEAVKGRPGIVGQQNAEPNQPSSRRQPTCSCSPPETTLRHDQFHIDGSNRIKSTNNHYQW